MDFNLDVGNARAQLFARLIGAQARDVALVPSVSAAAGLVAAQFTHAAPGENLVIGAQEYSSNHFPWRQLEQRGYAVRQVPFQNGGMEADVVRRYVDGGTRLVAVSAIQTASGHRSDLAALSAIARSVGAWLFVDASQAAGAVDLTGDIAHVDFLSTSDHKFLLNAARGMGYLYMRREVQGQLLALGAGWRAGAVPFESFFGPKMVLSDTASRFDHSISWLAAIGDEVCLELIHRIGPAAIHGRVLHLANTLRQALEDAGRAVRSWAPESGPATSPGSPAPQARGPSGSGGRRPLARCPAAPAPSWRGRGPGDRWTTTHGCPRAPSRRAGCGRR